MSGSLQNLSNLLQQLQADNGLMMTAVVGLDGMVIDSATDGEIDAEMVSAVAAPGLLMMNDLATELGEKLARITTLEYDSHVAILAPLNDDTLLISVADPGAINLGQLRIVLRRSMDQFRTAFDEI